MPDDESTPPDPCNVADGFCLQPANKESNRRKLGTCVACGCRVCSNCSIRFSGEEIHGRWCWACLESLAFESTAHTRAAATYMQKRERLAGRKISLAEARDLLIS